MKIIQTQFEFMEQIPKPKRINKPVMRYKIIVKDYDNYKLTHFYFESLKDITKWGKSIGLYNSIQVRFDKQGLFKFSYSDYTYEIWNLNFNKGK